MGRNLSWEYLFRLRRPGRVHSDPTEATRRLGRICPTQWALVEPESPSAPGGGQLREVN